MAFQTFDPFTFRMSLVKNEICLSYRVDKLGNYFWVVQYDDNHWVRFEQRSSAIDFINSNFR